MSLVPAQRHEDLHEFKANLCYKASSGQLGLNREKCFLKKQKQIQKTKQTNKDEFVRKN